MWLFKTKLGRAILIFASVLVCFLILVAVVMYNKNNILRDYNALSGKPLNSKEYLTVQYLVTVKGMDREQAELVVRMASNLTDVDVDNLTEELNPGSPGGDNAGGGGNITDIPDWSEGDLSELKDSFAKVGGDPGESSTFVGFYAVVSGGYSLYCANNNGGKDIALKDINCAELRRLLEQQCDAYHDNLTYNTIMDSQRDAIDEFINNGSCITGSYNSKNDYEFWKGSSGCNIVAFPGAVFWFVDGATGCNVHHGWAAPSGAYRYTVRAVSSSNSLCTDPNMSLILNAGSYDLNPKSCVSLGNNWYVAVTENQYDAFMNGQYGGDPNALIKTPEALLKEYKQ